MIIPLFFSSCGGGPVPKYLREAKVDVSIWTPKKEIFFKRDGLNLVKAIVPLKDSTKLLIASNKEICRLKNNALDPNEKALNLGLSKFDILKNKSGEPSYIVGSGLWGKPSAAVLDVNGQLKWKCTFKDGKKYGELPYEEFYEDGQLREKIKPKGNIFFKEAFYPNGKLSEKGQFENGVMSGIWQEYHEKEIWKGEYDSSGSRSGTWKVYDYNNKHIEDVLFDEFGPRSIKKN